MKNKVLMILAANSALLAAVPATAQDAQPVAREPLTTVPPVIRVTRETQVTAAAAPNLLARPPRSIRPESWISMEDYPARALRDAAEGNVRYRMTVGTNGRGRDCVVTISSGHEALDEGTCRLLEQRGLYEPARDAQGNAVDAQVAGIIEWKLELSPEAQMVALVEAAKDQ